jgi:hypothetical protein
MPDGAEGPSAAHLLACFFSNPMQLNACNDTGGGGRGFSTRPQACVPNNSPLQARFKESTQ